MSHEIIHRSLDVFTRPSKPVSQFLARHYERRYAGRYRFARTLFIIDYLILTAAVALAALSIVVSTAAPAPPERVRITLATEPPHVKSGDRAMLVIQYENREHDPIGPVALRANFPSGFELTDPPPGFHLHDRTINLGTLDAGARGEIAFGGVLRSPVGTIQRFYVSTVMGSEVRTTVLPVKVKQSVIAATITASPRVVDTEPITATLEIRNTGNVILNEVVVLPKLPVGTAAPTSTFAFAPGAIARFSYTLTAARHEGELPIGFEVALREGGALIPQGLALVRVEHIKSGLSVESKLDPEPPIRFDGTPRALTMTVRHNGARTLRDGKLQTSVGDFDLGTMARGDIKTFTATITPAFPFTFERSFVVEGTLEGVEGTIRTTFREPPFTVATLLTVRAVPLYYTSSGEQIGRGPLPPRAGETTTYWVSVTFKNQGNTIRDFSFRGWLPLNVRWRGEHTDTFGAAARIFYESATRRVFIRVPVLPREGEWTASFALDLTPTRADIGKAPWLFLPERVSGHETEVNVPLELRLGEPVVTNENVL